MKPKKQRSSLVISFLHPILQAFILKVDYLIPKGSTTGLWLLRLNTDDNLELSPKNVSLGLNVAWKLRSASLSLQPLLHWEQKPNWIPGCCGCHKCPSIFTWMTLTSDNAPPVSARTRRWMVPTPHTLALWGSSHMKTLNISAAVPDLIRLLLHMSYLSSSSVLF